MKLADVRNVNYADSTASNGATYYYKIVTINEGNECGKRIVCIYASTYAELTNRHINRVLMAGGSISTIEAAWLDKVISWLLENNLAKNLLFWTNPAFGCKLRGNVIEKVFDLGTTRLPRGGDYTPVTSNTTYNPTGVNGTVPAFVNETPSACGYYGSGRLNNIRRKSQITVVAAYEKPNNSLATFLSLGDLGGFYLQSTGDSLGSASFTMSSPNPGNPNRIRKWGQLTWRIFSRPGNYLKKLVDTLVATSPGSPDFHRANLKRRRK